MNASDEQIVKEIRARENVLGDQQRHRPSRCQQDRKLLLGIIDRLDAENADNARARQAACEGWEKCQAELAKARAAVEMGIKLADYLESATEIIEDDGGDEEDVRDAMDLIAKARALFGVQPSKERETP